MSAPVPSVLTDILSALHERSASNYSLRSHAMEKLTASFHALNQTQSVAINTLCGVHSEIDEDDREGIERISSSLQEINHEVSDSFKGLLDYFKALRQDISQQNKDDRESFEKLALSVVNHSVDTDAKDMMDQILQHSEAQDKLRREGMKKLETTLKGFEDRVKNLHTTLNEEEKDDEVKGSSSASPQKGHGTNNDRAHRSPTTEQNEKSQCNHQDTVVPKREQEELTNTTKFPFFGTRAPPASPAANVTGPERVLTTPASAPPINMPMDSSLSVALVKIIQKQQEQNSENGANLKQVLTGIGKQQELIEQNQAQMGVGLELVRQQQANTEESQKQLAQFLQSLNVGSEEAVRPTSLFDAPTHPTISSEAGVQVPLLEQHVPQGQENATDNGVRMLDNSTIKVDSSAHLWSMAEKKAKSLPKEMMKLVRKEAWVNGIRSKQYLYAFVALLGKREIFDCLSLKLLQTLHWKVVSLLGRDTSLADLRTEYPDKQSNVVALDKYSIHFLKDMPRSTAA